jgi:hypothetical protein
MESPTAVGSNFGLYLYCLFAGPPAVAPEPGIEATHATFVLSYGHICALVSRVPLKEYNEQTLNQRLRDLPWLTAKVRCHEAMVRSVMGSHPVMPVTFGTIYLNAAKVLGILKRHYREIHAFLTFIHNKEEWGIKVYANGGPAPNSQDASELTRELDHRLATATPGEVYLLQKQRQHLLRQHVRQHLDEFSHQLYQQVLSWCIEGCRNRLLSQHATGNAGEMILNAAFLVAKPEVERFTHRLEVLAMRHVNSGLSFALSGPWPPYNFCPDVASATGENG